MDSPCIARGLFSDGEEPYDRRLLPARLPVGSGDRVLIVQDSQALEGFEQLVTLVAQGDRILSSSREHRQQGVLVETTQESFLS